MNQKEYLEWIKEKELEFVKNGYDEGSIKALLSHLENARFYSVMAHYHPEMSGLYKKIVLQQAHKYTELKRSLEVRVEMPQWRGDYLNGRVK
jgi:hypothetical protein